MTRRTVCRETRCFVIGGSGLVILRLVTPHTGSRCPFVLTILVTTRTVDRLVLALQLVELVVIKSGWTPRCRRVASFTIA